MVDNMDAELIAEGREYLDDFSFTEMLIWRVPAPVQRQRPRFQILAGVRGTQRLCFALRQRGGQGRSPPPRGRRPALHIYHVRNVIADFDAAVEEWRSK